MQLDNLNKYELISKLIETEKQLSKTKEELHELKKTHVLDEDSYEEFTEDEEIVKDTSQQVYYDVLYRDIVEHLKNKKHKWKCYISYHSTDFNKDMIVQLINKLNNTKIIDMTSDNSTSDKMNKFKASYKESKITGGKCKCSLVKRDSKCGDKCWNLIGVDIVVRIDKGLSCNII